MNTTPASIIKASPKHKWYVVVAILACLFLGTMHLVFLRPHMEAWMQNYAAGLAHKSSEELSSDFTILASSLAAGATSPLMILGLGFLYQGVRVHRSGQYPYPGMMLLRDALMETGSKARRRYKMFLALGIGLLLSGIIIGWYIFVLFHKMLPLPSA